MGYSPEKNKINGSKLLLLTESNEEMKKKGFSKIGQRKIIIQHMKDLKRKFIVKKIQELKLGLQKKQEYKNVKKTIPKQVEYATKEISKNKRRNAEDVISWDIKKISNWLSSIQCLEYLDNFKRNKIAGDILLDLDEESLDSMGINKIGAKKRILLSLNEIITFSKKSNSLELKKEKNKCNYTTTDPMYWSIKEVRDWFSRIGMDAYKSNIDKYRVNGKSLIELNEIQLKEMGINSTVHINTIIKEIKKIKKN